MNFLCFLYQKGSNGSVLNFDEVFDLRYHTTKSIIFIIILNISRNYKGTELTFRKTLLENSILSIELASLLILEHKSSIHHITLRFAKYRNQEVQENNENQELIGEPKKPNEINSDMTNPPVNIIAFVVMHLCGPKLIAGWVDVTYRVFECCYEESAHVIELRVV